MSKTMQNLVILVEPSEDAYNIALKGGNKILNRFCIDEDAAFELSGFNDLKKSSVLIRDSSEFKVERKAKGKSSHFYDCILY